MESYVRAAAVLSAAGMLLLPLLGLLLRFQPQFVHGLHVSASSAEVNCYISGGLYGAVFVACSIALALRAHGWYSGGQDDKLDEATRRNRKYGLPFVELETKEFVRAMEELDRKSRVVQPPVKEMELPKTMPNSKAYLI